MCLAQGPQHSDAGEVRPRGLSVSSQALYHRAIALPSRWSNTISAIPKSYEKGHKLGLCYKLRLSLVHLLSMAWSKPQDDVKPLLS